MIVARVAPAARLLRPLEVPGLGLHERADARPGRGSTPIPEWPRPDQGSRGLTRSQQFQYAEPEFTPASSRARAIAVARCRRPR